MAKAIIIKDNKTITKSVKTANFFTSRLKFKFGKVKINQTLPFRIKFTNIGIQNYPGGAAPIGIAIIGVNNYIL